MKADLIVLVPDRNTEAAVTGLLSRAPSLSIRKPSHHIVVHPEKDPGVRLHGHEMLRLYHRDYQFGLVLFDREGSGADKKHRAELEAEVQQRLDESGWKERAKVVVLDPELEIWVWSDSPVVDEVLGWTGRKPSLRQWLHSHDFLLPDAAKPSRPKEALEAALREVRRPRSSSVYEELASRVSLERCSDPAFGKLRDLLRAWFGTGSSSQ